MPLMSNRGIHPLRPDHRRSPLGIAISSRGQALPPSQGMVRCRSTLTRYSRQPSGSRLCPALLHPTSPTSHHSTMRARFPISLLQRESRIHRNDVAVGCKLGVSLSPRLDAPVRLVVRSPALGPKLMDQLPVVRGACIAELSEALRCVTGCTNHCHSVHASDEELSVCQVCAGVLPLRICRTCVPQKNTTRHQ